MTSDPLLLQEKESFDLGDYRLEILSYLGCLSPGVHYFQVHYRPIDGDDPDRLGLLRVGSLESGLYRELALREILAGYGMIAPLLSRGRFPTVRIHPAPAEKTPDSFEIDREPESIADGTESIADGTESIADGTESIADGTESIADGTESIADGTETIADGTESIADGTETFADGTETFAGENGDREPELSESERENSGDYLEEEYYPVEAIDLDPATETLLLLTDYPRENATLATYLERETPIEESLSIAIQVCQCFSFILQRQWCFVDLLPPLIEIGKPLHFFDLTTAYPLETVPDRGLTGSYCAPELGEAIAFDERMSTYTVGALLYRLTHGQLPRPELQITPAIEPIPRLHQLLKISLSPIVEERFSLAQFLSLLVETRNLLRAPKIQWDIASHSTIGLSTQRLQNEDNYGVKQTGFGSSESLLLGAIADGMGGMAMGEIASQLAIRTVLEEPIPTALETSDRWQIWLDTLFEKANETISQQVKNGGTTLSVILAVNTKMMLAHVGDSRVYLLRGNEIEQLSEDHTMVAMLVASGQLSPEEAREHPDRNILTKSLGEKQRLSPGYVQDLRRTTDGLSLTLEDGDLLLLCSDGVWDLIPPSELADIFRETSSLSVAVNHAIERVLQRGASDNATLVALRCRLDRFC